MRKKNNIDKRLVTDNFLDEFFPIEPQKTQYSSILNQTEKYLQFKEAINHKRNISGQKPFSDYDITSLLIEYKK